VLRAAATRTTGGAGASRRSARARRQQRCGASHTSGLASSRGGVGPRDGVRKRAPQLRSTRYVAEQRASAQPQRHAPTLDSARAGTRNISVDPAQLPRHEHAAGDACRSRPTLRKQPEERALVGAPHLKIAVAQRRTTPSAVGRRLKTRRPVPSL
jgi:hypothetical protein